MVARHSIDETIVASISGNVVEALPVLPKKLLAINALVRENQIPFSHIQILVMVQQETLSISELSKRLAIAKPNITPLVDELCSMGYVERVRDEQDRRVVRVRLKEAGAEKLKALEASVHARAYKWVASLSRSEAKELNNALASILRIMHALPDEN